MKHLTQTIIKISNYALVLIIAPILIYLIYHSFKNGTNIYANSMTHFATGLYIFFSIVGVLTFVMLIYLFFQKMNLKLKINLIEKIFIIGSCFYILFATLYWNYLLPYIPEPDPIIVWQAVVLALENNFIMFGPGGYINIYPQQKGLMFLYEIIFQICNNNNFSSISNFNALTAPIALLFGYLSVKEIYKRRWVAFLFVVLFLAFLPFWMYTVYNYGDMPVVAFVFLLIWSVLKYRNTEKWYYTLIGSIAAIFLIIFRSHGWILIIALCIGIVYEVVQHKKWKNIVAILIISITTILALKGIDYQYKLRSGYEIEQGMHPLLWVAMGLQFDEGNLSAARNGNYLEVMGVQSDYGAGYYNDYSKKIYFEVEGDYTKSGEIAFEYIKDRIYLFSSDLTYTNYFFENKILLQWIDPLFEVIKSTGTFGDNVPNEFVTNVFTGDYYKILLKYSYYYQIVIYVFALIGCVFVEKKSTNILNKVFLISFIGGFVFSIIWEAKSRYVLLFFIMLIPYAAVGLDYMIQLVLKRILFFKDKRDIK